MPRRKFQNNYRLNSGAADGNWLPVVGATAQPAPDPSFFPRLYSDNVNYGALKADELLTVWDFLEQKGRIGKTHVIFNKKDNQATLRILDAKSRSRHFDEGRSYMAWRINKRLGKFSMVPGLMETVTYDPKLISQIEAWAAYGSDVRRFLNSVNQYRLRRGWRRTHCLWVVEVQPDTGYPHVHMFFPNLKWLAPVDILTSNWSQGRANIKSPERIMVNCAGYISKYLRKMEGWDDLPLAFLRSGGCRMYGFSRGFSAKPLEKESEWARWHVIRTENLDQLVKTLEEGGYIVEDFGATSRAHAIVLAVQNGIIEIKNKRSFDTFVRGFDRYVLCIFCSKANLADDYKEPEPEKVVINHVEYEMDVRPQCPSEKCRGDITETIDWEEVRKHHPEYPEIPERGVVYDYDIKWYRGYPSK